MPTYVMDLDVAVLNGLVPPRIEETRPAAVRLQRFARARAALAKVKLKRLANNGLDVIDICADVFEPAKHRVLLRSLQGFLHLDDGTAQSSASIGFHGDQLARLAFNWEFTSQNCANLPEGLLFGVLGLSKVQLRLGDLSLPESAVLRIFVRTGVYMTGAWQLKLSAGEPVSEWAEQHWFRLWHFSNLPLVSVHVELPHELLGRDATHAVACFCIPPEEIERREPLPLTALCGAQATGGRHSTLLPSLGSSDAKVLVHYRFAPEVAMPALGGGAGSCFVGVLRLVSVKLAFRRSVTAKLLRRKPAVVVQAEVLSQSYNEVEARHFRVPDDGALEKSVRICWERHVCMCNMDTEMDEFFSAVSDETAMQVARRIQYQAVPLPKLGALTVRRELPLITCCAYSPLVTRAQRYATLSSAILFACFVSALLFNVDCQHVPGPALCRAGSPNSSPFVRFWLQVFSWNFVIASLWGVLLSIPVPLIFTHLFKKRVVLARTSQRHREIHIRFWLAKERLGWVLVALLHFWCVFYLLQFVRFHSEALLKKWLTVTWMSAVERIIFAPAARVFWIVTLLAMSQHCGACDTCLANSPHLTTFKQLTVQLPAKSGGGRGRATNEGVADQTDENGVNLDMGAD